MVDMPKLQKSLEADITDLVRQARDDAMMLAIKLCEAIVEHGGTTEDCIRELKYLHAMAPRPVNPLLAPTEGAKQ